MISAIIATVSTALDAFADHPSVVRSLAALLGRVEKLTTQEALDEVARITGQEAADAAQVRAIYQHDDAQDVDQ